MAERYRLTSWGLDSLVISKLCQRSRLFISTFYDQLQLLLLFCSCTLRGSTGPRLYGQQFSKIFINERSMGTPAADAKPVFDLIKFCNDNPEEANEIIAKGALQMLSSELTGVPWITFTDRPLNTTHINKLVSIRGSVIRVYEVLFKNVTCEQQCLACNASFFVDENETKKRGADICNSCFKASLRTVRNFRKAIPSQSIRIQDIGRRTGLSETVEVLLEGDAAGNFVPGDKVFVAGVVMRRWKQLKPNEQILSTLVLRCISIAKEETDERSEIRALIDDFMRKTPFERRHFLLDSFSASLLGLAHCKLAILLALVSSGPLGGAETPATRHNIHILLVGEPGTGKTHLLKTASKLISPAVFTNGVGTSEAGLTSCAIRLGKEWSLDGGVLVLSDTGICCIDEFHCLKLNEKSGLLEAMEQQTISVAKAGMVATLRSRCSVIAAAKRPRCMPTRSTAENLGLSTPLISRFDLIFSILDVHDHSSDIAKANAIFDGGMGQGTPETHRWSQSTLHAYISHTRRPNNTIPDALCQIILRYYSARRKKEGHNEFNTIRMLESLVRITEAHSRLMNHTEVSEEDVYIAIILMELTVGTEGRVRIDPEKAFTDEAYYKMLKDLVAREYSLEVPQ